MNPGTYLLPMAVFLVLWVVLADMDGGSKLHESL
jgi:hypothetical protein